MRTTLYNQRNTYIYINIINKQFYTCDSYGDQRGTVLKLVVSPNLLKQENVCLIPREAEHPSKIRTSQSCS